MTGGHHFLEVVASRFHETPSFVLSVQVLADLQWSTQSARVFLPYESGQDFRGLLQTYLVLRESWGARQSV